MLVTLSYVALGLAVLATATPLWLRFRGLDGPVTGAQVYLALSPLLGAGAVLLLFPFNPRFRFSETYSAGALICGAVGLGLAAAWALKRTPSGTASPTALKKDAAMIAGGCILAAVLFGAIAFIALSDAVAR